MEVVSQRVRIQQRRVHGVLTDRPVLPVSWGGELHPKLCKGFLHEVAHAVHKFLVHLVHTLRIRLAHRGHTSALNDACTIRSASVNAGHASAATSAKEISASCDVGARASLKSFFKTCS